MRKVPLPDGAKLYLYTAALTAIAAAGAISNAQEAVVTVANTLAAKDLVVIDSDDYPELMGRVARVKAATATEVTLERVDTSDGEKFSPGGKVALIKLDTGEWQRLPYVPEFQNAVSIDYVHELAGGSTLSGGVTWTYVGSRYSDFSTSPAVTNHARIPDYNTLDLRLAARFGQISVEAFARNLTDSQGLTNYSSGGGAGLIGRGTIIQPRTLGMRLGFKY